ncbi:MAG: hypothetical protein ACW99A_09375 [Candidatus Kariarchaeaceae archaeon]|jgi:hypothetical protein
MKLHVYSEGIELEDYSVNLEDSFQLLENQSSKSEVEDNFIGFTLDDDDLSVIQFVRRTKEEWLLDIPTYENKQYVGSLSSLIGHHQVFSMTREFFNTDSTINKSIRDRDYDSVIEYSKKRFGISYKFEVS